MPNEPQPSLERPPQPTEPQPEPLDPQANPPAQTPPESSSKPKSDLELTILRRLATTLSYAVSTLDNATPRDVFVLFIPPDDEPVVTKHTTREEVAARLCEVRLIQEAETDPEKEYFVYIFQGSRWQIVKGRTWKLYDGIEMFALTPQQTLVDAIDDSGSLREPPALHDAVDEPDPVEDAEEEEETDELFEEQ
jgi:hypothetical protein